MIIELVESSGTVFKTAEAAVSGNIVNTNKYPIPDQRYQGPNSETCLNAHVLSSILIDLSINELL